MLDKDGKRYGTGRRGTWDGRGSRIAEWLITKQLKCKKKIAMVTYACCCHIKIERIYAEDRSLC